MVAIEKPKIEVRHTSIIIRNYHIGDSTILENMLSVYDQIRHKMIPKAMSYNKENNELRIPRGIDINFLEKEFNTPVSINYTADESESISVHAKQSPKDDVQREAIAFLIGAENYQYTKKYSQLLIATPTGSGKTYIVSTSLQFIGQRTFFIVPNEKLKKQMIESLLKFTDIKEDHIVDVSGKSVINKIMKTKDPKYKVYVTCHGTLISYAKNEGWESVEELFRHCRIGLKVYDEAHLFFENVLKIDHYTNTKKTIYMTATFKRSDYKENRLFDRCFKNVVKFGFDKRDNYRKHVMYLGIQYNSKPSIVDQSSVMTRAGFSKTKYANYQVEQDEFYDALSYTIKYFLSFEGKMLILCTTIDGTEKIKKFVKDSFDDVKVSSYHSKISQEERENAFSADIICTTPQSAGTGADIPGLRVMIMCESYSSEVQAEQAPGRLREYNEIDDTYYVELVDIGFPKVYKMWKGRLGVFKKKCKKLLSLDLSTKK